MRTLPAMTVLVLACASCGRDYSADGTWYRGGVSGDHFGSYVMQLRRDGDRITGVACRLSSGHRIFVDRPVSGKYPQMSFDHSLDNSGTFRIDLRIVDDDLITGIDNNPVAAFTYEFARAPGSNYEECASARP